MCVLGRASGRRATPAGGGWMALFFRGDTRKFFLILLGRRWSEKNCAGFDGELREFSRGVMGGCWGCVGVGWPVASKRRGCAGGGPRVRQRALAGRRATRVWAAERARPHPWNAQRSDWSRVPDVHTAGAAGEAGGCPHRSIAQGFEWRLGADVHTAIGPRFERMPTLTIEIHSATSRCRREISTPSDPHPADATFALTFLMHRIASRFGGAISTPLSAIATLRRVGPAVGATQDSACSAGARRVQASVWMGVRLQALAGLWGSSVHAVAQPNEVPVRVWISPPSDTQNPVNFDGERRHAIEAGCRFGCG